MALYTRHDSQIQSFSPWLLVETPEIPDQAGLNGVSDIVRLKGGGEFRNRIHFRTWSLFLEARDRLSQDGIPHFCINNPVRQHLLLSGQTLFRDMRYGDLHRLQLDIETLTRALSLRAFSNAWSKPTSKVYIRQLCWPTKSALQATQKMPFCPCSNTSPTGA
jgi:hypothetical protein